MLRMSGRIDEEVKALVKSDEETLAFIEECRRIREQGDEMDMGFETERIKQFVGKDFIEAAFLPQHNFMLLDDAFHEQLYAYYHDIWREVIITEQKRRTFDLNDRFVRERMAFINSKDIYNVRWLSFLVDNGMEKEDFYDVFGKNMYAFSQRLLMQYYGSGYCKKEYKPYDSINYLERERYCNMVKNDIREFLVTNLYSTNMATFGKLERV